MLDGQRIATDEWQSIFESANLTASVLTHLNREQTHEASHQFFIDVLTNRPRFLTGEVTFYISIWLQHPRARAWMATLKNGDFSFDALQFGRLLLAYGEATLTTLVNDPEEPTSIARMAMLHELLTCTGLPVVEDEICMPALEFWSAYVEYSLENAPTNDDHEPRRLGAAREHVFRALLDCWFKIKIPDFEVALTWDADTRHGLRDFRTDVADFLLAAYSFLGVQLLKDLVSMALACLEGSHWEDLEATLFCISVLNELIVEHGQDDGHLERLLGSPPFASALGRTDTIPDRAGLALVDLLRTYAAFFERHPQYIAAPVHFLFQCLDVPTLAIEASKAIASICSSCRQVLVPQLDALVQKLASVLGAADTAAKSRLLGAVASVIQALDSEESQARQLQILVGIVELDVFDCQKLVAAQQLAQAEEAGVAALQSLARIGKAMQAPDDIPIDLESEAPPSTFWHQGPGAAVQSQIVRFVGHVCDALPQSDAVVEAACGVFKSGFTEKTPGPFVFSSHVTTAFLLSSRIDTPRLGLILSTACALISSHSTNSSRRIDQEAQALLGHVIQLVHQLGGELEMHSNAYRSRSWPLTTTRA